MRVHFIAIGGAAMHNLAIALHLKGYEVSGSDDAIYEPSRTRLAKHGLLPDADGWRPELLNDKIDAVILGMHARADNPELLKAQSLGLKIYSYPEYVYEQARNKKRVVIGGSHGKTTITSMILHVLNYYQKDFDYLVGAQIAGFENMVRLSDAPVIVIEGDEYLASPIDRRPKFHLYKAHVGVISGVAWDHINVFPTFDSYKAQFSKFIDTLERNGTLIYCAEDEVLKKIVAQHTSRNDVRKIPYETPLYEIREGKTYLVTAGKEVGLEVFGKHNLQNLTAARLVCAQLDVSEEDFYAAIASFSGAAKRLEKLGETAHKAVFKDFAHSPSKLKATVEAVKSQYPQRSLIACIELHTFSSLNENFLNEYSGTFNGADFAVVYIDQKTFEQKKLKPFNGEDVMKAFGNKNLLFYDNPEKLKRYIESFEISDCNLLMMSSGTFGSIDLVTLANSFLYR
ncbi:peptidoglycan synthetase [Pelobium manganitolerans]|uniref:Peptidoglycan synthetase n=1 Tax=Pelobium manganitolerans TaxID=1842495 RepID=A0A419S5Q4_9SPHI|nr:Mur ligase family protein [Pelobium manganitolerans]RKD16175.1 peptidoglycan synthetase [Pelobium manganitolerans]